MKIIFNHVISDWYWQIYDELIKNHHVVLPDNFKSGDCKNPRVNLQSLEKCVKENQDSDFIFDLSGDLIDLINWKNKNLTIPMVIFNTNVVGRPFVGKMTAFAPLWYVNANGTPLMMKYNRNNLIYEGMAANPYTFYPIKTQKQYDISYIGRFYGDRSYWLNHIRKFCINNDLKYYFPKGHGIDLPWTFKDINKLYNQTKINIAFAQRDNLQGIIKRRVNLRTFEINMSGNFQLLQFTPCIEEYFEIDNEIVCWKNKKELFDKILYFLENTDEREKIAKRGYQRALKDHTWSNRFEKIKIFLDKKGERGSLSNVINKIDNLIATKELKEFQNLNIKNSNKKLSNLFLKKLGYKVKWDIKKRKSIKIPLKDGFRDYKPNLSNFYFIKLSGKILMVIRMIPQTSKINLKEWKKLEKIVFLIENYDLSLPQYGILTNGFEWIIQDFKDRRWIQKIPNRKILKSTLSSITSISRFYYFFKNFYWRFRLEKLFPSKSYKETLRFFFFKLKKLSRKLFNTLNLN